MTEIQRVLRRAAIRLLLGRIGRMMLLTFSVAVAFLLLVRIGQQMIGVEVAWLPVWIGATACSLAVGVIWAIATRPSMEAVARAVDEQGGLRESLSTAWCVQDQHDPWSEAAVAHACVVARKVLVRQYFPVRVPRTWPVPIIGVMLFLVVGLFPQGDILALIARAEAEEQHHVERAQAQETVESIETRLKDALAGLDDEQLQQELDALTDQAMSQAPEEIHRSALKKLTNAKDRLNELRAGEKSQLSEQMRDMMQDLRQPGPGPLDQFAKSLQQGDFEQANKSLQDLMKKIASEEMSEDQRAQLAEQLRKLGEQLEELAGKQDALKQALEDAGIDPELAGDPEALRRALEQNQQLNEQQLQQLQKLAQASRNAGEMCKQMGGACQNAAAGMNGGETGLADLGGLGDQLSELEMLEQEMAGLDAAEQALDASLAELSMCMGESEGANLLNEMGQKYTSAPPTPGQRGRGAGAADEAEAKYDLEKKKSKSPHQQGPIIGSMIVEGDQVRGESRQQFDDVVRASAETAAEAIESDVVPREYHDAIKHYFGRLDEQSKSSDSTNTSESDDQGE